MALDGLVRLAIHGQQPRIEESVEAGLALFLTLAVGGLQYVARGGGVTVRGPVERQEGIEERADIAVFLRQAGGHLEEGRHVASLHGIQRRRIGGDADRQAIGPDHGRRARRRRERHRTLDKRRRDRRFFQGGCWLGRAGAEREGQGQDRGGKRQSGAHEDGVLRVRFDPE